MIDDPVDGRSWAPTLLAASTVGVYLLVLSGVTHVLANAAGACPAWPTCGGHLLADHLLAERDPKLLIVFGHRLAAVLVAGLLALTAIVVWRSGSDRRVRIPLAAAVLLYPLEVWIGAVTALSGGSTALSGIHLVVAMGIFSALLLALLRQLEAETPGDVPVRTDEPVVIAAPDVPVTESTDAGSPTDLRTRVWAYVQLTKPRLWWLLCLVAFAAMGLAAGGVPPIGRVVGTMVGGVLAVGASGTFNHVIERDVDRRMDRTADRPIATARIPVRRAVAFGVLLAGSSLSVFLATTNVLSAALGMLAILFYTVVYTVVLKPNTSHNTVLGGAVGAFPALIGWAAVTDEIGMPALALGTVVFLWTPAHFYSLAILYRDDYARAGFPMLPVVRGEAVTRRHILGYLGATMLGAVVLSEVAPLDWVYAVVVVAVGAVFLWAVVRLYRERTERAAFRAFMASNAYLGLLLVAIVVDTMLV